MFSELFGVEIKLLVLDKGKLDLEVPLLRHVEVGPLVGDHDCVLIFRVLALIFLSELSNEFVN